MNGRWVELDECYPKFARDETTRMRNFEMEVKPGMI